MVKTYPRCNTPHPLSDFHTRSDGRPVAYCKPCLRAHNARYDRKRRPGERVYASDPLNLVLREMPGFRSSLLGIAEAA